MIAIRQKSVLTGRQVSTANTIAQLKHPVSILKTAFSLIL
jgi:hypothetical protein